MTQLAPDGSTQAPLQYTTKTYPYTPSIAYSASSSSSSVFSADVHSSQSSAPSSVKSANTSWEAEANAISGLNEYPPSANEPSGFQPAISTQKSSSNPAVPLELRQHPRRTQTDPHSGYFNAPPLLLRQVDRKENFVESLVGKLTMSFQTSCPSLHYSVLQDTTTQMIEVIWPLSVVPCGRDAVLGGKNLIGLRTFIQEVLKRSKTSYSTLQVALYYLVLIKPHIPKIDFTKEQLDDSPASRAMQCGRRMFLAALVLASKYLQDRNYSARAWSKISGLKVSEINTNEMAFVTAVDWKLHIPEPLFQRWTDVVIIFSLSAPPSPSFLSRPDSPSSWRSIIPRLNPELDGLEELANMTISSKADRPSRCVSSMSPPPTIRRSSTDSLSSGGQTPLLKLEVIEPTPRANVENFRFPPISPRITQLPTPLMTPRSNNFCTPAVGASGFCFGKPAMRYAMKQVQSLAMARCAVDTYPCATINPEALYKRQPSRRSSLAPSTASSVSSPESMISDVSSRSRSSRSSSVSSVAAGVPLSQPSLAVQATHRCATMQMVGATETAPLIFRTESPEGLWSSPNTLIGVARESYVRGSQGCQDNSDAAAAITLQEMAVDNQYRTLPLPRSQSSSSQRKRERPLSISESSLQAEVQSLLPNYLEGLNAQSDDPMVLEDPLIAKTFLLDSGLGFPLDLRPAANHMRSASGSREGSRKRMCCKEQAWTGYAMPKDPLWADVFS